MNAIMKEDKKIVGSFINKEQNMESKVTNSKEFKKLYKQVSNDEKVTKIIDAVGITIVRKYDEKSEYFKDGKRMFIKLYVRDGFLVGGVDMVEENKRGGYTIFDSKKYKKKFTNFYFGTEENIKFSLQSNKVFIKRKNKKKIFSLNDFVDLLVKNHLSDKLLWTKKKNYLKKIILKGIFILTDSKYDYVDYYHEIHEDRISDNEKKREIKISKEPFFKYFKIYKNMLFVSFVFLFCMLIIIKKYKLIIEDNFSTSNPILLFSFTIILFLLHYLSSFFHIKKKDREGFIYKLHNSSLSTNFKLKIK